jgi:predicted CoA-binding protein
MTVNHFMNLAGEGNQVNEFWHPKVVANILRKSQTIAVVGLSPKANRPSYQVAAYLQQAGYTIIPVNPGHEQILGEICYRDLASIDLKIDVVNIFRRSEQVMPIIQEAIAIGARSVWMQQGIINAEAARLAEQAGLAVVMDRCMKTEHIHQGTLLPEINNRL